MADAQTDADRILRPFKQPDAPRDAPGVSAAAAGGDPAGRIHALAGDRDAGGQLYATPHGSRPAPFVGLDNYTGLLDDPVFWQALRNNAVYAAATIPSAIVLALLMALAVNGALPGRAFLRLAYFLPTMLPMIAVANIWMFFYTPDYGLFDRILGDVWWRPAQLVGRSHRPPCRR